MNVLIPLILLSFIALGPQMAQAQDDPVQEEQAGDPVETNLPEPGPQILSAVETSLDDWLWQKRVIVVFADSPNDPRFVQQMQFLRDRLESLEERDVVILTDDDPAARSSVRQKLRARGFMLVVLAKDGSVVIRKPAPWDAREISRSIDKLPLRKQEIADHGATIGK